jgi:DNA-binding protein HU-beta
MAAQKKLMTKGQTVNHFAGKFEISKKAAASIVEEYAALAIAETRKKGAFVLPGIGKSVLVKRKARKGRNPATGETIMIPAKTVVKIRPAKAFKEAIVPSKK